MCPPKHFLLALGFYTRLPCPKTLDYSELPQAAMYLPVIGWLVGGLSASVFYLASLVWPQMAAVILALISGMLITGAFHEDGFADVCDGFGGGYGKQQILDIMKDSAIGVYGALGLQLLLLLKIILLSALPAQSAPWALLAGHSISRLAPLLLMRRYRYARTEQSKSKVAVFRPGLWHLLFAFGAALLPFVLLPTQCLLAVISVMIATVWLGSYFNRHIGGYTGDCLGASQQLAETVFYLTISARWTFT